MTAFLIGLVCGFLASLAYLEWRKHRTAARERFSLWKRDHEQETYSMEDWSE